MRRGLIVERIRAGLETAPGNGKLMIVNYVAIIEVFSVALYQLVFGQPPESKWQSDRRWRE